MRAHVFILVRFVVKRNLIIHESDVVLYHLNHHTSSFMFLRVISSLYFGFPYSINEFFREKDVFIFVL